MPENRRAVFKIANVLSTYLIIPILALVSISDLFFFNNRIKNSLPMSLEDILVFNIIFNLPHIFGSSLALARKTYVRHYKKEILIGIILSCLICLFWFSPFQETAISIFSVLTINHVIGQQMGLGFSFFTGKRFVYLVWQYFGIFIGVLQFFDLYKFWSILNIFQPLTAISLLLVPYCFLCLHIIKNQKNKLGRWLATGNSLLILSPIAFYISGYMLFTSLIPRFIHDTTAFYAYFVHNFNFARNDNPVKNKMRGLIPFLAFYTIFLPIILSAPVSLNWFGGYSLVIGVFISSFHYYTEHFSWRSTTGPRAFLTIV